MSDLYAPESKTPLFGQMYCIDPQEALLYRQTLLQNEMSKRKIKNKILSIIEYCIREFHPFAKIYKTGAEMYKEALEKCILNGEMDVPNFRVLFN